MDGLLEWFDTTTTGGTFLVIGIVGVTLLLLSFVLEGIFEAFDFGDGPLSLTTIAAFGAVFGFVGYASVGAGASPALATFAGAVTGLLGGVGAWRFAKFFENSSSSASIRSDSLTGELAMVILRINGGDSLGEVALMQNGIRHTFAAMSAEPIAVGTKVSIVATISDSSVMVEAVKAENIDTPENKDSQA